MSDNKELRYKLSLQDLFSKKMQGAVDQTKRMDSTMSGLGTRIAGVAAGLGLGALAKEMVSTGAKFDSYKLQLETLLGSQRLAADAFNQIKADAAKTPFDVESLTRANSMLISAGASAGEARETVLGLGNAIAATGGGSDELMRMSVNLQQIKTLGKASAMDVKQFAFAGIPIYQMLAKTMGITVEKARTLDVTYEQLKMAFEKSAAAGGMFAGGLEKQSKSIGGQISNLKDQFTNTLVEFYDRLKPAIASIISGLSSILSWVAKNKETIVFLGKVALGIGAIVVAYKSWIGVTQLMQTAQLALNTAMTLNPIGAVIAAVMGLVAAFVALKSEWDAITERIQANDKNAFQSEITAVETLTKKYSNLNKEQAISAAISEERTRLSGQLASARSAIEAERGKGITGMDNDRLLELTQKERALRVKQGALGTNSFRSLVGDAYDKNKGLASAKGGKTAGGSSSTSGGSSTEISATRPQSIVININDGLVKNLTVQGGGGPVQDWAQAIRREISKALVEVGNDANNIALNS